MNINLGKLLAATGLLLCMSLSAKAVTYFVSTSGNDSNNGVTTAGAKRTVQAAIDAAAKGDLVQVASGTYLLDSAIVLKEGVNLKGISAILDGQGSTRVIYQAGSFATTTTVEGFTVQNGQLSDRHSRGAGAYLHSNVTLRSCIFSGNAIAAAQSGSGKGAGLYLEGSGNRVENCTISGNTIDNSSAEYSYTTMGAGLYCGSRNAVVSCTIAQNKITNAGRGSDHGGGAYALSQTVVDGCTISNNEITKTGALTGGTAQGGGVHLSSGTLKNSSIFGNRVYYTASESGEAATLESSGHGGGGVYAGFSATVHKNTILSNSFSYSLALTLPEGKTLSINHVGGGGLMSYSGNGSHATITNNVVSDNQFVESIAEGLTLSAQNVGGGGIHVTNVGYTTIDSCIAYNNAANGARLGQGGGMYIATVDMLNATNTGSITAMRCDLRNNSANVGGGLYAKSGGASTTTHLISSLVANNTAAAQGGGVYLSGPCNLTACSVVRNLAADVASRNLYNEEGATIRLNSTVVWGSGSSIAPSISNTSSAVEGLSGTGLTSLSANNTGDSNSPYFVNPTTNVGRGTSSSDSASVLAADWGLQANSILINKGSSDGVTLGQLPKNDLRNNLRICNELLDIGALEYGSCMPAATPPAAGSKITWDSVLTTLRYGEQLTLSASIAWGNVKFTTSNEAIASIEENTLTARAAGVVEVVVYEEGNEQNFIQQSLVITPREVTVRAENQTKGIGTADPALTFTFSPSGVLVGSDKFSGALSRTPGDTAGVYDIFQGTLSLGNNYEITFVGAQLMITHDKPLGSRVYYVSPNGMDSNTGTSWGAAKAGIQAAVRVASLENPKAEVWIAAGTYTISAPLVMLDGVNVYGGFEGTEENLSERPPIALGDTSLQGLTIINGNSTTQLLAQPYPFTDLTTWDGITFINGKHSGNGGGVMLQHNGALQGCNVMYCHASRVGVEGGVGGGVVCNRGGSLNRCHVAYNRADRDGGGVYLLGSSITEKAAVKNTVVALNAAGKNGGGIYATYQSAISGSTISGNTAGVNGGGLYGSNATTLDSSVVMSNSAVGSGGGAYGDGKLDLSCVQLDSNRAAFGGGLYLREGGSAMSCGMADNEAEQSGGGIYFYNGGEASGCSLQRNTAGKNGGGAFFSLNGTLRGATVSGNAATLNGGGLYFENNGAAVSCTVVGNRCVEDGGGVYFDQTGRCDSTHVMYNTAISGGGIYVRRSGTFSRGSLQGNTATEHGGGAYLNQPATVSQSLVADNYADKEGGGIYSATESKIARNRIINNRAGGNGGGIFCDKSNLLVSNLLANNTATNGGGAYAKTSNHISSCTFVRNYATEQGGGLFYISGSKMTNSVAWGNGSSAAEHSSGAQVYINGSAHTISYCAVESDTVKKDSIAGEGNIRLSLSNEEGVNPPLFRSVSRHIGADSLDAIGILQADWRLSSTLSACYNSGSNEEVPEGYTDDLAGRPRIYEEVVDMGAYEWVPLSYTGAVKTPSGVENAYLYPNPTSGSISIRTSFAGSRVQVFSLSGALLYDQPLTDSTLDLSALPSGTLIIRITGEGKTAVGKVVKG